MKALTIKQPWASLIAAGVKDVENRTWDTRYRGPLLIHAGKGVETIPTGVVELFSYDARAVLERDLPRGGIIARAQLVDVVTDSPSEWAGWGQFHWVLAEVEPVEFEACRGMLGLWDHPAG